MNRNTGTKYFHFFREIFVSNIQESHKFEGEIELDESYLGGRRKSQRGRGAAGKVPVFGLLKKKGKVYTTIINNAKFSIFMPIIKEKTLPDFIVYTDTFKSYNALDVSGF